MEYIDYKFVKELLYMFINAQKEARIFTKNSIFGDGVNRGGGALFVDQISRNF